MQPGSGSVRSTCVQHVSRLKTNSSCIETVVQLCSPLPAQELYTEALDLAPGPAPERAVYYANRAACYLKLDKHSEAAQDCTAALASDPAYIKALLRRCAAYEALDDLERALADAQAVSMGKAIQVVQPGKHR